jgi:L-2-deoxyfucosyltransferase/glycosyltransferase DesVII
MTLGVSNREVHGHEQASVDDLLAGVADLDVEVIATFNAGQLGSVTRVPDNVRVVDFVPLNDLLPSCSAIVHQGGGGTIGNAVVHGVPQLVIPGTTWGEEASAQALADRGAGRYLRLDELSPDTLREEVRRLLDDPSFRACAAEIQHEMLATPTPADLVADLQALTGR